MLVYRGFLFEFFGHQIVYAHLKPWSSCDQQLKVPYVLADSNAVFHEESESLLLSSPRPTVVELQSFLCEPSEWNCAKPVRALKAGLTVARKRCALDTYVLCEK